MRMFMKRFNCVEDITNHAYSDIGSLNNSNIIEEEYKHVAKAYGMNDKIPIYRACSKHLIHTSWLILT